MHKAYSGKNVLVTGHTGFKGSWLTIWLQKLGANVIGYSLPPPTNPNNFEASQLAKTMTHIVGDIRDFNSVNDTIQTSQPDVIFHLAAQPIVLHSFDLPKETFDVNVGGTVNVLEAARKCPSVKAIIVVTTDKCYENHEWTWGYRENDPLGGHDPYSSSKSMVELAVSSYRHSFFNGEGPAIASARAGNVIGGGDFSEFRLIPDTMKALLKGEPVKLRNPKSVRPWLNVLDPLYGYLLLGARLLNHGQEYAQAWNFGPAEHRAVTTQTLVEKAIDLWGDGSWVSTSTPEDKPEMHVLRLNWDKAANHLHWYPRYDWEQALEETVNWFKTYEKYLVNPNGTDMRKACLAHIEKFSNTNV